MTHSFKFPLLAGCFLFGLLVSSAAVAMPGMMGGEGEGKGFAAMDTDKDGKVTKEEFFARHKEMKEAAFDAIDTDKDGVITAGEWEAFTGSHSKGNAEAHGGMPPAGEKPAKKDGVPDLIPPKN